MKGVFSMRKSAEINIVVYFPDDITAFDKVYIDAVVEAVKQLAEKAKA